MKGYSKIIATILFLIIGFSGFSQFDVGNATQQKALMPSDVTTRHFTVEQDGCNATVVATIKIKEGWHINALHLPEGSFGIPTTFKVKKSSNYKIIGDVIAPKPLYEYAAAIGEKMNLYKGTIVLKQKIKVTTDKDFDLAIEFGYQPCDSVKCLFPTRFDDFIVHVKGCENSANKEDTKIKSDIKDEGMVVPDSVGNNNDNANKDSANQSEIANVDNAGTMLKEEGNNSKESVAVTAGKDNKKEKKSSLWLIFWLGLGAGFAALLTPCVFPMIPMTVSFFTKQNDTKAKGIKNAVIYGVSIVVIYVVLGLAVTAITEQANSLNNIATNPYLNIVFFLIFALFGISFLGAFEFTLPSSWVNKIDSSADKTGGMLGIFFMALVLVLVSFSCTLPFVGSLLAGGVKQGGVAPAIGMLGFSLALALPFVLFAAFPGWMNSLPKSGGWLNSVKVVLGLVELAFAFKFLSGADLTWQTHFLPREIFLAIWIAIFLVMALYLFGKIRFPLDSPIEKLSVGRGMLGTLVLAFVIYLIPGMWGAPVQLVNAFAPPLSYSESPLGVGRRVQISGGNNNAGTSSSAQGGSHLIAHGVYSFRDYDKAKAYAQKVNKPLFIDFTGFNCANCRKMEQGVWGEPGIVEILKDSVVIASLHVDSRVDLPKEEQVKVKWPNGKMQKLETYGDKWAHMELSNYHSASQPYYVMQLPDGTDLSNGHADYQHHRDPKVFLKWLQEGLKEFHKLQAQK